MSFAARVRPTLEVPAARLRQALAELPGVGQPIVSAFIMRRQRLERDKESAGLRIVVQEGSRQGRQLDDFLDKNHVPHRLITFECPDGQALCERLHLASRDLPALITANALPLRRPSLREVARVAETGGTGSGENGTKIRMFGDGDCRRLQVGSGRFATGMSKEPAARLPYRAASQRQKSSRASER
jgi:hypothetical protein